MQLQLKLPASERLQSQSIVKDFPATPTSDTPSTWLKTMIKTQDTASNGYDHAQLPYFQSTCCAIRRDRRVSMVNELECCYAA
jgi:hypothetical protein